jgi:twitching motility protein PilT
MRTRDYVEKGEGEGKTLLDAMRDGDTDGMQHFDGIIEKYIREGLVDFETGMGFATNAGNLRLELADLPQTSMARTPAPASAAAPAKAEKRETEIEIER